MSVKEASALDRLLLSGMAWTAMMRWSSQIISWLGTAYAARILTPGDYGLVGMAMLAVGLLRLIEDFGMDSVLVQDRSIDGPRQARLAGLILLTGVLATLSFTAIAQPIAGFFKEPQVALLVAILGSLCLFDALQVLPRALLQREMEFRRLGVAQLVQTAATQAVLVTGATLGWGIWSLVFNTLGGAFVVTVLLIYWRPFAVRWPRGLRELSVPLLQGWRMMASRFAWYAYTSADQTIIGRLLGKEALGSYSFATTFSTTISQEITSVANKVVPGVFSAVQDRRDELRRYFLLLTELLCLLALPVSFGTAVVADLIVHQLLGPQWTSVIVPLRVLCIYSAFYSCQVLIGHLLLWTGHFRANMWCSVLAAVVMPASFYVGSHWGLPGVAWAWVISFPVANIPAFVIAFRVIGIDGWKWLHALLPSLLASLLMVVAVMLVRVILPAGFSPVVALPACILAGVLAYGAASYLLFRSRLLKLLEFVRVIRRLPE